MLNASTHAFMLFCVQACVWYGESFAFRGEEDLIVPSQAQLSALSAAKALAMTIPLRNCAERHARTEIFRWLDFHISPRAPTSVPSHKRCVTCGTDRGGRWRLVPEGTYCNKCYCRRRRTEVAPGHGQRVAPGGVKRRREPGAESVLKAVG
jgi:hypothetical protein